MPPHDPTQALIWSYAVQILYNPILALVKSSVLIFLTRLFGQKDWVRRSLLWLNVANISQMVAVFFAIMLQCTPVAFNWDLTIRGGHCVDRRILYVSTSVFNILTDFIILGLPLWVFTSLKIPRRTKIALLVVFLLGFLYVHHPETFSSHSVTNPPFRVTLASTIRLILLVQGLFNVSIFPNSGNNVGFVTSAIETNLALITASAPALRPIFRSRDRGGWFARSVMATTKPGGSDPEMGQKAPFGWERDSSPSGSTNSNSNSKSGRGGSRGGRKAGGSSRRGGGRGRSPLRSRGSGRVKPTIIRIRTEKEVGAELLRSSPRSSEEQTMTNNGIVRVSDIQREIDGIVKDIAVAGAGTYTGGGGRPTNVMRPVTPKTPKTPAARSRPSMETIARPRPSMETITVGAMMITPLPRPGTSGSGVRRVAPERYYSESIYPEQGVGKSDEWDDDDRVSKYLDRRFGVVTPKGTTPTAKGWEGSGRPF